MGTAVIDRSILFTSIRPITGAFQGRGDSHNIVHNISVKPQTS